MSPRTAKNTVTESPNVNLKTEQLDDGTSVTWNDIPEDDSENPVEIYKRLAAHFETVYHDNRGGAVFDYITGEQCASRLNEVLGVHNWNFRILKNEITTNDEVWVLGELTAFIGGREVVRQQFGSQKIKNLKSTGQPLDIGFDLKGASTDAMKKCASLLGVGLYLSKKESKETPRVAAPARAAVVVDELISDENDPLWQRYNAGVEIAKKKNLPASNINLPLKTSEIRAAIVVLGNMIKGYEAVASESGSVA